MSRSKATADPYAETTAKMRAALLEGRMQLIDELLVDAAACRALLAKDPNDRYPSAALFLEDLSAVSAPIRTSVDAVNHPGAVNS